MTPDRPDERVARPGPPFIDSPTAAGAAQRLLATPETTLLLADGLELHFVALSAPLGVQHPVATREF